MTKKPVTARSIKIIAKVTSYKDGEMSGKLDSIYFEEPYTFSGVVDMINIMETTFDALGFPDKALLPRTFGKAKQRMRRHEMDLNKLIAERSRSQGAQGDGSAVINKETLATFEIYVSFRLNAEWQGKLHHIDSGETNDFSSIVEMMKLIDKALA